MNDGGQIPETSITVLFGRVWLTLVSLMDIVVTLEGVRVLLLVIDSFHLDRCVEKVVVPSADVGDAGERLEWFQGFDVY